MAIPPLWRKTITMKLTKRKMKNKYQAQATRELIKSGAINDEKMFRDLTLRMINDMPFDELQKLFSFEKIDPLSSPREEISYGPDRDKQVASLRSLGVILYSAELNLPRYSIEDIEKCVENWGMCKVEKEYIEKFLNGC